jgi:HAD superfamily hydrolase (TIGR01490 family)
MSTSDARVETPPRRAALFDLDRTLVHVNTAALYMRWQVRRGEAHPKDLVQVLFWLAQYTFGFLDAEAIARRAALGVRGREEASFASLLRDWVRDEVLPRISSRARVEVEARKRDGYLCAVLTSSTPYSAVPVAEALGIEHVLATRLEVIDGRFTGLHLPPLAYGPGKVSLAEDWARDHDVDLGQSVFFTDSISDLPMLERVGEAVVVNPDPRLRWLAWRRGWLVRKW